MFQFASSTHSHAYTSARSELSGAFLVLSVCICTGAIAAACVEDNSAVFSLCTDATGESAMRAAFAALCFPVFAFLLGSSYYGFCLLPLLSAGFGFFIYIKSAMALEDISGGIFFELLSVALPVLLLVPCFFVVAVEAFLSSKQLHLLISRRGIFVDNGRPLHFILCIPFLAVAAFVFCFFGGH